MQVNVLLASVDHRVSGVVVPRREEDVSDGTFGVISEARISEARPTRVGESAQLSLAASPLARLTARPGQSLSLRLQF